MPEPTKARKRYWLRGVLIAGAVQTTLFIKLFAFYFDRCLLNVGITPGVCSTTLEPLFVNTAYPLLALPEPLIALLVWDYFLSFTLAGVIGAALGQWYALHQLPATDVQAPAGSRGQ